MGLVYIDKLNPYNNPYNSFGECAELYCCLELHNNLSSTHKKQYYDIIAKLVYPGTPLGVVYNTILSSQMIGIRVLQLIVNPNAPIKKKVLPVRSLIFT